MFRKYLYCSLLLWAAVPSGMLHAQQTKKPDTLTLGIPLHIPIELSANFAELRSNHFHAGLDIRTQGRIGIPVYAPADGYVSRLKITHADYGKALYITHPNGYTTVYGHLTKFAPQIETHVKENQYRQKTFQIELFPDSTLLRVKKGQLVAYTGNTGGSGGPHLHYEVRETASEKTLNPLNFSIKIKDTTPPVIRGLYLIENNSELEHPSIVHQVPLEKNVSPTVKAIGRVGIGIDTYDTADNTPGFKHGAYSVEMFVDGQRMYGYRLDSVGFDESYYINSHILYDHFIKTGQHIEKCYIESSNPLCIYEQCPSDGTFEVKDGKSYQVNIIVGDFYGNKTSRSFTVTGDKNAANPVSVASAGRTIFFDKDKNNRIIDQGFELYFPSGSFVNSLYPDIRRIDDQSIQVHHPGVCVYKNFDITIDIPSKYKNQRSKTYIAYTNPKGKASPLVTTCESTQLRASARALGQYHVLCDTIVPRIQNLNLIVGQKMSSSSLRMKIQDTDSGIKSYNGFIDNQWILMEYDYKQDLLTYDMSEVELTSGKHTFYLRVEDHCANVAEYTADFYK